MYLCWNGALLCKNHHLLWLNHSYNATLLYMVIYNMNHKWLSTNCKYYLSNNFDVMIKLISRLDFIRNFMIKNEVKDFFLPQSMDNTKFGIFVLNLVSRVQKNTSFITWPLVTMPLFVLCGIKFESEVSVHPVLILIFVSLLNCQMRFFFKARYLKL